MKLIKTSALALFLAITPLVSFLNTGCSTSAQVVTYKTLASIGEAVDVTMKQAADARHFGQLSDAQWQEIKTIHDTQFIPAYRLAVDAGATSGSPAPANIVELSTRLASLLAQYLPKSI